MNPAMPVIDVQEIRLSTPEERERWDNLVSCCAQADVYHRASYIIATAEVERSQALGIVVTTNGQQYFLPMLLRPIVGPNGENWIDACTPYGYGGVICLNAEPSNPADLLPALKQWCASRNLVCCVLRTHPLLGQDWLFRQVPEINFVNVTRRGETTAVPLEQWDEDRDCPPGLSKGRRSDLALARRNLRVTCSSSDKAGDVLEQLRIFRDLYENTMQRLDATQFFHFPWSYYERLATLTPALSVAIAWHRESPVAGSLFLAGPRFAHYHLSASNEVGQKFKASTLLLVNGAKWARGRGCRKLHLGGGMLANDSLMMFKRSFGGKEYQFGHMTLISDRDRYESLSSAENPIWPYQQRVTTQMIPASENRRLKVILMGKDKPTVRKGLEYLVENGFTVVAVVGPEEGNFTGRRLVDLAAKRHIPTTTDTQIYDVLEGRAAPDTLPFCLPDIDLVVSLLFWKRIRKPLIDLPKIACINFHPAPLPEFRGIGGYNVAIMENLDYWGAAVHKVDETFDTGELIDVRRFDIDASSETAFSLEQKTQDVLLELFRDAMEKIKRDRRVVGKPQGEGRYFARKDFERLRRIQSDDSPELIARKIRAFWYPPMSGASIVINGNEYTLVDENILTRIVKRLL